MPRRGLEPPRDFTPTSTSSWRVCQFRHLGDGLRGVPRRIEKYTATPHSVEPFREVGRRMVS